MADADGEEPCKALLGVDACDILETEAALRFRPDLLIEMPEIVPKVIQRRLRKGIGEQYRTLLDLLCGYSRTADNPLCSHRGRMRRKLTDFV